MISLRFIIVTLLFQPVTLALPNKIGITSIPKCGTFLMVKCIELLKQQVGTNIDGTDQKKLGNITNHNFFYCHLPYSPEFEYTLKRANYTIFFIYRDPRDQIVSHAYWTKKLSSQYQVYKNHTIEQLITALIKSINPLYSAYLKWLKSNIVCSIKFENLIGPQGGGNDQLQRKEINKICKYLGINSKELKNNCIENLFGGSTTFRKGQIGSWKQHFSQEQKDLFKKIAGKMLIELGYENDNNW